MAEGAVRAEYEERVPGRDVLDVGPVARRQLRVGVDRGEVELVRPMPEEMNRERPADRREEEEEDDEDAADNRGLVASEAAPHLLPVAAGPYLTFNFSELAVRLGRNRRPQAGAGGKNLGRFL